MRFSCRPMNMWPLARESRTSCGARPWRRGTTLSKRAMVCSVGFSQAWACLLRGSRLGIARSFERIGDLAEDGGIVDRRGHLVRLAIGDAAHGAAQDLAGARLGQPRHHPRGLEARHRADALA